MEKDDIEMLLIANTVVLFFAGFDTSSSALTMTLAYLATNPDVQEKLYQEINDAVQAKDNDNIEYEVRETYMTKKHGIILFICRM